MEENYSWLNRIVGTRGTFNICKRDPAKRRGALTGRHSISGGWRFYLWLKENNYPNDPPMQVLCFNCNCAKGFYKICPHVQRPVVTDSVVKSKYSNDIPDL